MGEIKGLSRSRGLNIEPDEKARYDSIIIRYSSEIGIKGKNRSDFENRLITNIKKALCKDTESKDNGKKGKVIEANNKKQTEVDKRFAIKKELSRIIISKKKTEDGESAYNELNRAGKTLKYVFGISSFSMAKSCNLDIDEIMKEAKRIFFYYYKKRRFKTFRVRTKRINKRFELTSQRISELVGEMILKEASEKGLNNEIKVNLKEPDFTLGIEILNQAYFFSGKINGLAGLPYGIEGAGIIKINNTPEREIILCCFLMMHRGIRPVLVGDEKNTRIISDNIRIFSHEDIACYNSKDEIPEWIKKQSIQISCLSLDDLLEPDNNKIKEIRELKSKNKDLFFPLLSYNEFIKEKKKRMVELMKQN